MKLIVTLVMLFLALASVGVAIFVNRKSHWIYAAARTVSVVLAVVLGVLITNLLCGALSGVLFSLVKGTGAIADFTELFEKVPTMEDAFRAIIGCILAPFVFLFVFLLLRGILFLVCKPVSRILITKYGGVTSGKPQAVTPEVNLPDEAELGGIAAEQEPVAEEEKPKPEKKPKKINVLRTKEVSPIGMACGAVCGLLLFVALLAPFVGFFTLAHQATEFLLSDEDSDTPNVVVEILDAAANNAGSKAVTVLGGKPIFSGLTSYRVGDHRVSLTRETRFLASVGSAMSQLGDEKGDRKEAANTLRLAGEEFEKTDLIPVVLPDLCHAASDAWDDGKEFCGIKKPSFGKSMDVFMNPFLDILADSTYDTVKVDVKTLLDLIATAVEGDAMAKMANNPIAVFEDRDFTASMLRTLLENPRMTRMVGGFLSFGVETVGDSFGMYVDDAEIHRSWLAAMKEMTVDQLSSYGPDEALAALTDGYARVFEAYGIELDPSAASVMANAVVEGCMTENTLRLDLLNSVFEEAALPAKDGSFVCIRESTVGSVSVLISVERLHFDSSSVTDAQREAQALSAVLADLCGMMNTVGESGFSMTSSIRSMGPILDGIAATQTIGGEQTARLLIGLLQSEQVRGSTGLSVIEITEIARSIIEHAANKGYATMMISLANTVDALSAANDPSMDLSERVETLMETMTVESAKVLQQLAKPGLMIANGVPEDKAEASASVMSTMFGNLALYGENMTEEDYRREADAVTHVTNLAMNATNNMSENIFGEGSTTGISAAEYVNQSLDSVVVSKTLRDTVFVDDSGIPVNDPLNTGMTLDAQEEAELLTALNDRYAAEADPTNEEVLQNYIAVGALINVPLAVVDGEITVAAN